MRIDREMIYDYLDGQLSPDQAAALEAWIKAHPDNARRFVRASITHSNLFDALQASDMRSLLGGSGEFDEAKVAELLFDDSEAQDATDVEPAQEPPKRVAWKLTGSQRWLAGLKLRPAAVAACAVIAVLGAAYFWNRPGAGVATLAGQRDARWASEGHATAAGSPLHAGRMSLAEGFAQIRLARGATVILDAPCEIELINDNELALISGKLSAVVRRSAIGFAVTTPSARIVDLGTEFGMEVEESGAVNFAVFTGAIEIRGRDTAATTPGGVRVTEGNAGTIAAGRWRPEGVSPIRQADRDRYERFWDEVAFRPAVFGDARYEPAGLTAVVPGRYADEERAWVFPERLRLRLEKPLTSVLTEPGYYAPVPINGYRVPEQTIAAGRTVNSFFLHFDPGLDESQDVRKAVVVLEFPTPVLGIICSEEGLYQSDAAFGMESPPRGGERSLRGLDDDLIELSEDRRKVAIRFRARRYIDQARIITEAAGD